MCKKKVLDPITPRGALQSDLVFFGGFFKHTKKNKINKNIINERKMRDCRRGYLYHLFIFYI